MNLYDEIARLAYELYETKGRRHGCDLEDWLEAEMIIVTRYQGYEDSAPAVNAKEKPKRQRKAASSTAKKRTAKTAAPAEAKPKRNTRKKKIE